MRRGFTLIEILIIIAILGAMMAIIMPSFSLVGSARTSMAARDSLRLMRYARNMALQTQTPITLSFRRGEIEVLAEGEEAIHSPTNSVPDAVIGLDIEQIGMLKQYADVQFTFLQYNDVLTTKSSSQTRTTTFADRLSEAAPTEKPKDGDAKGDEANADTPFTITVKTNGTTRPFRMRVYEAGDPSETSGDFIDFDFLCSGTIEEKH